MPSPLRDPKSLTEWIETDYYRRPRQLRRVRRPIIAAAFLAGLALLGLAYVLARQSIFQAGPLTPPHRMFTNDCHRCHVESFQTAFRVWPGSSGIHSVPDGACRSCHEGAIHNEQQVSSPACVSCHREHRGLALLAQVEDRHCTACHADLHRQDGQPSQVANNVRDFAAAHPEFALWSTPHAIDPGHITFNHQVHLQANGVPGPGGKPIQLDCRSCHQFDAMGRYALPINNEQHCAKCHPLSVQVVGTWKDERAQRLAAQFRQQPAPHRRADEVRAALRDRYARLVQDCPSLLGGAPSVPASPVLPGQAEAAVATDAAGWVDQQLKQAERALFDGAGGCRYCHQSKNPVPAAARPDRLPDYWPSSIPNRWFARSRFSHDKHRMLSCDECHVAADSTRSSDVLMPRIDTCRKCHNPQTGARSDCIECHRYHDRAKEQGWRGIMTIEECTRGR